MASVLLYVTVFLFFVHKPLTVGITQEYYQKKISYLKSIDSKKIIILAGSNGRFSHRCETIENELKVPCVNMSITADISLDYQFEMIKPYLKSGDIVYLPLEYGALSGSKRDIMSGSELPYIVAYDHRYLLNMDFERTLHALFYFDLKFLISGIGEILFDYIGIKRRYSTETLTPQGDESGHTSEKSIAYRDYIDQLEWTEPSLDLIDAESYKAGIVKSFMRWAKVNEVRVVGGLPTFFNDTRIPDELIRRFRQFYKTNGHAFIVLENRSQYPRMFFYDSGYHLLEEYQIKHSKMLAQYFLKLIKG